jgi:hypothetical protein
VNTTWRTQHNIADDEDISTSAKPNSNSSTHSLLNPPHIPRKLDLIPLLLLARLLQLAPRGEEEQDGTDRLRDEREELVVEGEEVLEREGGGREAEGAGPLRVSG